MQHKFFNSPPLYSTPNSCKTVQKSQTFKSKPIFKQAKRTQHNEQACGWSKYERGVFARQLLRVVSREFIVQSSLYQNVSRVLQKSPKNVYNFHIRLLQQYRTNENIISSILGGYFAVKKQAKLQKTLSCNNYDLNLTKLDLAVPVEVNYILETFLTAEFEFMEAMCMVEKNPEGDFDSFYYVQICEYEMEGIECSDMINFQAAQIQCQ